MGIWRLRRWKLEEDWNFCRTLGLWRLGGLGEVVVVVGWRGGDGRGGSGGWLNR